MPDHDALRAALSYLDSTAALMLAEIRQLSPDRWPGALARLAALVQATRESTGAAIRLLDGQEAAREVRAHGTPIPAPLPIREQTVELRARDK